MLELLVVVLGFAICLGMISCTKRRADAKLSVDSLHNLVGKLGALVVHLEAPWVSRGNKVVVHFD